MRLVKQTYVGPIQNWIPPQWKDRFCQFEKDRWQSWYLSYLSSQEWKHKRINVLGMANWTCQECQVRTAVEVHHLDYRDVGDEDYDQLMAVCQDCHRDLHGDY